MRALTRLLSGLCVLWLVACSEEAPPPPPPAPPPPAAAPTAAVVDAGAMTELKDAGDDAGAEDAGTPDAGTPDAGGRDGGSSDAGEDDAGATMVEVDPDAWVEVTSKPSGADITLDGKPAGQTPAKVPVVSGAKVMLEVTLTGYAPGTRELTPVRGDTASVDFALKPGATLNVTSDPPDASVTVNGRLVLERTPGVTKVFPPGPVEVVVRSPGYDDFTKKLTAKKGEQKLVAKLAPQVTVAVTSTPSEASVTLDGQDAGVTPTQLRLSSRGKYTLVVTKPGWSTVKQVLNKPSGEAVDVKLSDLELDRLQAAVDKAMKAYDAANAALQRAQRRALEDPNAADKVDEADERMVQATSALEEAESALAAAKAKRAR